jgi:hypothetical protein
MSDEDVNGKFRDLAGGLLEPGRRDALLAALWDVDKAALIGKILDLTKVTSDR